MEKEKFEMLKAFIEENKGKRKFSQSVELAINFKGVDFNKQEEKLNLEVKLPNGKGQTSKVTVFADDALIAEKAKAAGAEVIRSAELPSISKDKARLRVLISGESLAQANLMPQIAKNLGQVLGPRNKMPKPIVSSDVAGMIKNVSNSVYIRSKGKNLPTVHCFVGKEVMGAEQIAANVDEALSVISKKVGGNQHIRSVYIKMTMSKPVRLV